MLNQSTVKSKPVEIMASSLQIMKLELSLFLAMYNTCLNYLFEILSSMDLSSWNCPNCLYDFAGWIINSTSQKNSGG